MNDDIFRVDRPKKGLPVGFDGVDNECCYQHPVEELIKCQIEDDHVDDCKFRGYVDGHYIEACW